MIKLYNTLSKQVVLFTPIKPPEVSLYVCGVTVYDLCHMGHARAYVAFDLLNLPIARKTSCIDCA